MTGLDTGFFVELLRGNRSAVRIWKTLMGGEGMASCSVLSVFELRRLALMGKIGGEAVESVVRAIPALVRVMWLDDVHLMDQAARLSQEYGIPAVDSLILAGLLRAGCSRIYTTDGDLASYRGKGVKVVLMGG